MFKIIRRFICKCKGHDWEVYAVSTGLGYYSYDIEKAGQCKRCGVTTH